MYGSCHTICGGALVNQVLWCINCTCIFTLYTLSLQVITFHPSKAPRDDAVLFPWRRSCWCWLKASKEKVKKINCSIWLQNNKQIEPSETVLFTRISITCFIIAIQFIMIYIPAKAALSTGEEYFLISTWNAVLWLTMLFDRMKYLKNVLLITH